MMMQMKVMDVIVFMDRSRVLHICDFIEGLDIQLLSLYSLYCTGMDPRLRRRRILKDLLHLADQLVSFVTVDQLIGWFCTRGHTNLLVPRRGILK